MEIEPGFLIHGLSVERISPWNDGIAGILRKQIVKVSHGNSLGLFLHVEREVRIIHDVLKFLGDVSAL